MIKTEFNASDMDIVLSKSIDFVDNEMKEMGNIIIENFEDVFTDEMMTAHINKIKENLQSQGFDEMVIDDALEAIWNNMKLLLNKAVRRAVKSYI